MPKCLLPAELAEIVCGLLVQPTLMNELKHRSRIKHLCRISLSWWRNIAEERLTV